MLLALFGAGALLATSDIVTATALMRALVYLVPLVLIFRVFPRGDWLLLKAALFVYALNSCATVLDASRELSSVIAVVPAMCLSLSIIGWSTTPEADR